MRRIEDEGRKRHGVGLENHLRDEDQPAEAAKLARDRTSDLYVANQLAIGNTYDAWNDVHTAALEDYGISDADLFHPGLAP
jgi:hypothetical protein